MHFKPNTHSAFLLFFVFIVISISLLIGAVSAEPAQSDPIQEQQVQTSNNNQAAAASSSIPIVVTFEKYPDGTPILDDTILQGDEFESKGIILSGAPEGTYCEEATSTAIMMEPHPSYVPTEFFLTTSKPLDLTCHTVPVKILFVNPVVYVQLTFYGASTEYTMKVYDQADNLLGTVDQVAVKWEGPFEISYSSSDYDIKYITFGLPQALTAVEKVTANPTIYLPIIMK